MTGNENGNEDPPTFEAAMAAHELSVPPDRREGTRAVFRALQRLARSLPQDEPIAEAAAGP